MADESVQFGSNPPGFSIMSRPIGAVVCVLKKLTDLVSVLISVIRIEVAVALLAISNRVRD